MSRYPWFRVYNEILTERKIERIGRMTHLPRVVIRGAWTTILAMANDSPERGYLMWTDSLWITEAELCADLEMEPAEFAPLLDAFVKMQMVTRHEAGGLSCTNFDKRQFKSDNRLAYDSAWTETRLIVLARDDYRCQYCGNLAEHVDHLVPKCQGGADDLDNLVAACVSCNCTKGGRTPEEAGMELIDA